MTGNSRGDKVCLPSKNQCIPLLKCPLCLHVQTIHKPLQTQKVYFSYNQARNTNLADPLPSQDWISLRTLVALYNIWYVIAIGTTKNQYSLRKFFLKNTFFTLRPRLLALVLRTHTLFRLRLPAGL